MNENKLFAPPSKAITASEVPAPELSIDIKATTEELAKDNDALAKAFTDVNGIGKEEPITDEESQTLVIKSVMDTAYQQILETRGPGAWEAEFHHASAVAQTF